MSKKRCFELSVTPSASMIGRVVLIGSVLSFAAACGRRDVAKTDSTAVDSRTTSTTTTTAATSSTPVESVSTGETTLSPESKANSSAAVTTGAAKTPATAAPAPTPVHHAAVHPDSAKTAPAAAAKPAAAKPATAKPAAQAVADTGQKTAADTSKKTAAAGGAVDHLLVSPQEYEGWKMFSVYCYRCHGVDAMGVGIAPDLRHSVSSQGSVTHEVFITTVTNGRLEKGMPTWKALLSPEQMEDLWLYINARSSNRLYPGRPHMAKGANP